MPKLTIDGREIEVAAGTTVLRAALTEGSEIPHYCWHPGLSISGNCRMCLVEVEKAPKLVIACSTVVADGMVVHTGSEKVKTARSAMMEFFLINHPLDCPICDQAGECKLQDYAVEHGTGKSRYVEPKLALSKAIDLGPHVMLDQERCIQCSRCIRFCDEISHTGELAFFTRGETTFIGVHPGKPLANAYSGNVVDICPVGALTLKEFRFRTRVWYLRNTPSVCAGCARGCNILVGTGQQQVAMTFSGQIDDGIKRLVPRFNEAVNSHWICDEGRLSYQRLSAAPRLLRAQSPAGTAAVWDAAVARAAEALERAAGAGKAAAILSPRLPSEDFFAWRALFEGLGGVRTGVRAIVRGADDDLLIRADKGANSKGAEWIFGAAPEGPVLEAVGRGEVETLLVVGDPLDPDDNATIDAAARGRIRDLVFVGAFLAGSATDASVILPAAAWAEQDGTLVNFMGRVQRVRRCHTPRGEGRPGWKVAAELAEACGVTLPAWTSFEEVLASMSGAVKGFEGLDAAAIGLLGAVAGPGAYARA